MTFEEALANSAERAPALGVWADAQMIAGRDCKAEVSEVFRDLATAWHAKGNDWIWDEANRIFEEKLARLTN